LFALLTISFNFSCFNTFCRLDIAWHLLNFSDSVFFLHGLWYFYGELMCSTWLHAECWCTTCIPYHCYLIHICTSFCRLPLSWCERPARPLHGSARLWWQQTTAHLTFIWREPRERILNTQLPQSARHSWDHCVNLWPLWDLIHSTKPFIRLQKNWSYLKEKKLISQACGIVKQLRCVQVCTYMVSMLDNHNIVEVVGCKSRNWRGCKWVQQFDIVTHLLYFQLHS
jgi:hypothetical protein